MTTATQALRAKFAPRKPEAVPLHEQTIVLYGTPKVGKTTLAAGFPKAAYIDTEQGSLNHGVNAAEVSDWPQLLEAIKTVEDHGRGVLNTIVIDTLSRAWTYCRQHVMDVNGWKVEADGPYGAGWAKPRDEFRSMLTRVMDLSKTHGIGCVLVTHEDQQQVSTPVSDYTFYRPLLSDDKAQKELVGAAQMILRVVKTTDKDGTRYELLSNGAQHFEAGDRSKRLPASLILPEVNPYAALAAAYEKGAK